MCSFLFVVRRSPAKRPRGCVRSTARAPMNPSMASQTRRRASGRDPSAPGRAPRALSERRPAFRGRRARRRLSIEVCLNLRSFSGDIRRKTPPETSPRRVPRQVPAVFFVLAPAGTGSSRRVKHQTLVPQAYENPFELSVGACERRTGILRRQLLAPVRH